MPLFKHRNLKRWLALVGVSGCFLAGTVLYSKSLSGAYRDIVREAASSGDSTDTAGNMPAGAASDQNPSKPGKKDILEEQIRIARGVPMPRHDLMQEIRDNSRIEAEREKERQHVLAEVAAEPIAESAAKLLNTPLSPVFCPRLTVPAVLLSPSEVLARVDELFKDPRIDKLMNIIKGGTPDERDDVYAALTKAVDVYMHELPDSNDAANPGGATVINPQCAMGLPLLLAAFPASEENLDMLLAMYDRVSAAATSSFPHSSSEVTVDMHNIIIFASDEILTHLEHASSNQASEALQEYVYFRQDMREAARAFVQQSAATGVLSGSITDEMLTDEFLDRIAWQYADVIGSSFMNQADPLLGLHNRQRIIAIARRVGGHS